MPIPSLREQGAPDVRCPALCLNRSICALLVLALGASSGCVFFEQTGDSPSARPDLGEELECASDEACLGDLVCVEGACVDLLTSAEHCGARNLRCVEGASCIDGLCGCGEANVETNAYSQQVFSSQKDGFKVWPAPLLVEIPGMAAPGDCEGQQACEPYALTAPHHFAIAAFTANQGSAERLAVRVLDGRGEAIETIIEVGENKQGRAELRLIRAVALEDEVLIFTLWQDRSFDPSQRLIASYSLRLDEQGAAKLLRHRDTAGAEFIWAKDEQIVDFSVTVSRDEASNRSVIAIPYVVQRNDEPAPGVTTFLKVSGAMIRGDESRVSWITPRDESALESGEIDPDERGEIPPRRAPSVRQ